MSHLNRAARTLALALLCVAGAMTAASSASAAMAPHQSIVQGLDCDAPLVDLTTGQVASSPSVTQAVDKLAGKVTLHVVVYNAAASDTSAAARDLIGQCPQWTLSDPTQIAPNVVIVVMDLQHHLTVQDGSDYRQKLDPKLGDVAHKMSQSYGKGDYAGALAAELNGIDNALYPSINWGQVIFWAIVIVLGVVFLMVIGGAANNSNRSSGNGFWLGYVVGSLLDGGSDSSSGGSGGDSPGGWSGRV